MNFRHFFPTALGLAALLVAVTTAMAEPRTLTGTVAFRERLMLPPNAVVEVKLVDVSLADAPSTTLGETTFKPEGRIPAPFELKFEGGDIKPGHTYALQARITVDGQLWFITTTRHQVFSGGADNTDIMMERVAADKSDAAPTGRWLAEDIRGGGVIDNLQTVLDLAADGNVTGSGGCNTMVGKAKIEAEKITFGQVASTMMACPPAAMDQEGKFFAALSDVRSWSIDAAKDKLLLLDEAGKTIVVLARM